MAVLADVTAQSLSTATSNGKNLPIAQPTTNKESRIREHPFMKEVKISLAFISIIYSLSLSFSLLQVA
jgi:hypothetical protein